MISPETLEKVRAASDIVEVIGGYLPLKQAGANFVALCPFHKEKTPSFHVNPQRQIFHCFGCHKGGDVFTFVREYESLSFIEAVRRLAERARIPIESEATPGQSQARYLKETLYRVHEQLCQRWQSALNQDAAGQIARDYLARRAVPAEAIRRFRLGYAPDAWDDTVNWAKSKGFDLALVEQGGLIIRRDTGSGYYDRFRGRLMFPICDEQGRVVGFSGRVLAGDEKTAKYVNSPETPIFTKGKILFGLDQAKRSLIDAGYAVICEGQLDLIACFMAGIQNIVAPQGTALTADHCRILKRYVEEVVLCFDSDTAGQNAALRALDDLLASELAIRVACVPSPHDPDSFIRAHGGPAFQAIVQAAPGFFDFLLDRLVSQHGTSSDRGRSAILSGMAESLRKSRSPVLIDTYAQKTAYRLGVKPDVVRQEFRRLGSGRLRVARAEPAEPAPPPPPLRPSVPEYWLLRLLFGSDDHVDWIAQHLDPGWLEHAVVRTVVEARLRAHREQRWHDVPHLLAELESGAEIGLVTEAVADDRAHPADPERARVMVQDVVRRLRDTALDRELARLSQQIAVPNLPDAEGIALIHRQQELRRRKRQPLAPIGLPPSPAA